METAIYKFIWNRKNKLNKRNTAPIELRVYIKYKQKYVSTRIQIEEKHWNQEKQRVENHQYSDILNKKLKEFKDNIEDFEYKCYRKDIEFNYERLTEYLKNENKELDFLTFMKNEIQNANLRKSSRIKRMTTLNHLIKFGLINSFNSLTYDNIKKFDSYLRKTNKQTSVYVHHKRLKVYINEAIKQGYLKPEDNPYLKFKSDPGTPKEPIFLTMDEIKRLEKARMPSVKLEQVRDVFIFSVYTGFAHVDYSNFNNDIVQTIEGEKWIKTFRHKSDKEKASVMLLPKAIEIINKYRSLENNRLLPVISNQKMNEYLKVIAQLCKINKEITTHTGRHTFATTVLLNNDIPLETTRKMLGHTNIKQTERYAKLLDMKIKKDMIDLKRKLKAGS